MGRGNTKCKRIKRSKGKTKDIGNNKKGQEILDRTQSKQEFDKAALHRTGGARKIRKEGEATNDNIIVNTK